MLSLLFPTLAWAGGVSVEDAVRQALARPGVQERVDAQIESARADVDARTALPTPSLELDYDQIFGDINVGYLEFAASVEQRFDPSRWRKTLRETLPHREAAIRSSADAWTLEVATAVRAAYFSVRYRQLRRQAYDSWIARLEAGLHNVEARAARGDASTFHVRRIERELEQAHARKAAEEAALSEAWAELEAWTGWETRPSLGGDLRPVRDGSGDAQPATHPELARLTSLERSLDAEVEALGSPWLRGWSLGAGYRYGEVGPSSGHGFLVSVSVPLALWNNHAPKVRRLQAEQSRIRSELGLRTAMVDARVSADRARLLRAQAALDELSEAGEDGELSMLAEVAFAAGEATLVELLDAHESEVDLRLSRISLQWEARRAEIALDRSLARGVPR